jgi:hypothetical protein
MSEQIPWESIITVIGVSIGWLLSQLTDSVKNRRRERLIKRALVHELSIIRTTFYDTTKNENRVPHDQYPLMTEIYDSVKVELATFLKPDSLAKVERTYSEIKYLNTKANPQLDSHHGQFGKLELDYHFQYVNFYKLIGLVDDAIAQLGS